MCKAGLTTATEGSTKESDCVCKLSCRCNHSAIKLGCILVINNITRHKLHPLYLNYIYYNCCSSGFSPLVFKSEQSGRTKAVPCLLMSSAFMVFHGGTWHHSSYPWNWLPSGELILILVSTRPPSNDLIVAILLMKPLKSLSVWGCLSVPTPYCSWEVFEVPPVVAAAPAALRGAEVQPRLWGAG